MLGVWKHFQDVAIAVLERDRGLWVALLRSSATVDGAPPISASGPSMWSRSWIRSSALWISRAGLEIALDPADRMEHGRVVAARTAARSRPARGRSARGRRTSPTAGRGRGSGRVAGRACRPGRGGGRSRRRPGSFELLAGGRLRGWGRSAPSACEPSARRASSTLVQRLAEHRGEGGDPGQGALEAADVLGEPSGRSRWSTSRSAARDPCLGRQPLRTVRSWSPGRGPNSTVSPQAKRSRIRSASRAIASGRPVAGEDDLAALRRGAR